MRGLRHQFPVFLIFAGIALAIILAFMGKEQQTAEQDGTLAVQQNASSSEDNALSTKPGDLVAKMPVRGLKQGYGLAFDGEYFWVSGYRTTDTPGDFRLIKVDRHGKILRTISIPGHVFKNGLAWDGVYLWTVDGNMKNPVYNIEGIDTATNTTISTIQTITPNGKTNGLSYDTTTQTFWYDTFDTNTTYQVDLQGEPLNAMAIPGAVLSGEASDGVCLYHNARHALDDHDAYIIQTKDGVVQWVSPATKGVNDIEYDGTTFSVPVVWKMSINVLYAYQIPKCA